MQLTYPKCTIAHLNDCTQRARQRLCYPTKPGPTAQPESVTSDLTATSSLASAMEDSLMQDSHPELDPTTSYKLCRSTRISKPLQRFKPYAKHEHDNGTLDDSALRSPPRPGMDCDPPAPLETSTPQLSMATMMGDGTASGIDVS